jgi:hypothetical protein
MMAFLFQSDIDRGGGTQVLLRIPLRIDGLVADFRLLSTSQFSFSQIGFDGITPVYINNTAHDNSQKGYHGYCRHSEDNEESG